MTFRLKSVTTSRMIHLATKQHLVLRWIYQCLSIDRVRVQELRSDREVAGKGQARQRKTAGRMDQLPGMLQSGSVAALRKILQQVFISRGRTENQEIGFSIKTQIIKIWLTPVSFRTLLVKFRIKPILCSGKKNRLLPVIGVSKLTARSISVCYARDDNIANWMFSFSFQLEATEERCLRSEGAGADWTQPLTHRSFRLRRRFLLLQVSQKESITQAAWCV